MITHADIIDIIKTKDEANHFQAEITGLIDALFSNRSFEDILKEHLSYKKKECIQSLLAKYTVDTKNLAQTQLFLQEMKSILLAIPIVTITLAFNPKENSITAISEWFIIHTKKVVLLDIFVDTSLLGGAIIAFKGVYKDYSIKHQFKQRYTIQRDMPIAIPSQGNVAGNQ